MALLVTGEDPVSEDGRRLVQVVEALHQVGSPLAPSSSHACIDPRPCVSHHPGPEPTRNLGSNRAVCPTPGQPTLVAADPEMRLICSPTMQVRQAMWDTRPALAAAVGRVVMDQHPGWSEDEVFPAVLVRPARGT